VFQVNSSVTFHVKPIVSEELFNRMVEVLDIIIGRRPKKRPKKKVDKWVSVHIIL